MSIGVLIIGHNGIGTALLGAATSMLNNCPLQTKLLPVSLDCDPNELAEDANKLIELLDTGEGVLVLTDLFGSTPCNIARKLASERRIHVVSGLNLSMLIRVFNYPKLTLKELSKKAVSGGKDGISRIMQER